MNRSDALDRSPRVTLRDLQGGLHPATGCSDVMRVITSPLKEWRSSPAEDVSLWWDGDSGQCTLILDRADERHWIVVYSNTTTGVVQYCVGSPSADGRVEMTKSGDRVSYSRRYLCDAALVEDLVCEVVQAGQLPDRGTWDDDADMHFAF